MKFGKVSPEKNSHPSMTINVRTRTPLEAHQMLVQGHPIDVMAGYYNDKGALTDDFWMLDKTAKLHRLVELRALEKGLRESIAAQAARINQINLENESSTQTTKENG